VRLISSCLSRYLVKVEIVWRDVACRLNAVKKCTSKRSGVFRIWQRGAWRARGARAYNGGLGAEPPAGSRGRAPGGRVRGRSPLKLKHFLLLNVQWKPQIRPFFRNLLENGKNAPFHIKSPVKNFHGRVKGGGIAPCPPKYATARRNWTKSRF